MTLLTTDAFALKLCGEKIQGEILRGRAPGASVVNFNGKNLMVSEDGYFLIAFGRDDKPEQSFTIVKDRQRTTHNFTIEKQKWDIQNIKGLPQKKVTPSEEDAAAIERERNEIREALAVSIAKPLWQKGFILPVEGRISGNFGGQRIMNDVPRNPHMGTDIAAPEGTKIKAASDGVVELAGYDYFYSGNVVVIDHGFGLSTVYAHMKDINVKKGQRISQGDILGTVGKTGRATGAHLHWGASYNNIRFNPMSLLKINDNKFCFTL